MRHSRVTATTDVYMQELPEGVRAEVGRSDSATDNAPLDMYDPTIRLKPREQVARRHDL